MLGAITGETYEAPFGYEDRIDNLLSTLVFGIPLEAWLILGAVIGLVIYAAGKPKREAAKQANIMARLEQQSLEQERMENG